MTGIPANRAMLPGDRVHRIHWVLGTDRLRAVCHCAAEREFEDPVELWDWLLAHPVGHDTIHAGPGPATARTPVSAAR
ncbi:hypothetical protein ACGFMK_28580 [Amycolatopsis sp. NPDC049252]|uniref:hypothetical protein n=1 Tax=Amycolatopsis sp. NPDC049252 TaxID=3363933 RepID=UPI003722D7E0